MFTCMVRALTTLLTIPNCPDVRLVFGLFQRWKLNGLDASTLRSNFTCSVIRKTRPKTRSSSLYQKPRTQLRLLFRLPKLKPVVVVNAAAFKYLVELRATSPGLVTRYGETPG